MTMVDLKIPGVMEYLNTAVPNAQTASTRETWGQVNYTWTQEVKFSLQRHWSFATAPQWTYGDVFGNFQNPTGAIWSHLYAAFALTVGE